MKPIYVHDCDDCEYLGTVMESDGRLRDWYFHEGADGKAPPDGTFVKRMSNEPSANTTPCMTRVFKPLRFAGSTEVFVLNSDELIAFAFLKHRERTDQ